VADTTAQGFQANAWILAILRGDSAAAQSFRSRAEWNDPAVANGVSWSALLAGVIYLGLPVSDIDLVSEGIEARLTTPIDSQHYTGIHVNSGHYFGRFRQAMDVWFGERWAEYGLQEAFRWPWIISLSLLYPQLDSAAAIAVDSLRALLRDRSDAVERSGITELQNARCHLLLYRVAQGDTAGVREAVQQLTPQLRDARMAAVCPALVEALIEAYDPALAELPALERLDSLLQRGPFWEIPANAAIVAVPRLLRQRGDYERALAAARRTWPWAAVDGHAHVARLKELGDLAVIVGDTASAIDAYGEILRLWYNPDDLGRLWTDSVRVAVDELMTEER
jgi:hypothetical protein